MAICTQCSSDMTTAPSCVDWKVTIGGRKWPAVPYGAERVYVFGDEQEDRYDDDSWFDEPGWDSPRWSTTDSVRVRRTPHLRRPPPEPWLATGRCGDCGVAVGGWHHPGCDLAECPACGGQLITCGCWVEAD